MATMATEQGTIFGMGMGMGASSAGPANAMHARAQRNRELFEL